MNIHRGERLVVKVGERLAVKVRLLSEPCLWCWEILDTEDGSLVESSWAAEWIAYKSPREALQAGVMRFTDLTRGSRGRLFPVWAHADGRAPHAFTPVRVGPRTKARRGIELPS